jgi:hypothetical protein
VLLWIAPSRSPAPSPTAVADTARLRETVATLRHAGELLDAGELEEALVAATAVLAVDPGSPAALRIAERAQEELEHRRAAVLEQRVRASVEARLLTTPRAAPEAVAPAAAAPTARPTPPLMTVAFDSPFPRGTLVVEAQGDRLDELRWDFTEPSFLGIRKGEGGQVTGELELPTGVYRLRVELHAGRRGQIAAEEFEHEFAAGSRWQLTIQMASKRDTPRFSIEPNEDRRR